MKFPALQPGDTVLVEAVVLETAADAVKIIVGDRRLRFTIYVDRNSIAQASPGAKTAAVRPAAAA